MFKNTDVKSGDLVFFQPENDPLGIVMKIAGMRAGHLGICYDTVIENNKYQVRILESNPLGTNMNIYDLETMQNVAVKFDTEKYDEIKMRQTIWRVYKEITEQGRNYSYNDAADAFINKFLDVITFGLWEKHRLMPDEAKEFCVETGLRCYRENGNKIVVECEDVADPDEVYLKERFGFRKRFGEVI